VASSPGVRTREGAEIVSVCMGKKILVSLLMIPERDKEVTLSNV